MQTSSMEQAQVLHLRAGEIRPGDEVVYLLSCPNGETHHVTTRADAVAFDQPDDASITFATADGRRRLPVTHPVVVVRGLTMELAQAS